MSSRPPLRWVACCESPLAPRLREWAPRIKDLGEQAGETHVLLNNCYRNYAQLNARQLGDLLAGVD